MPNLPKHQTIAIGVDVGGTQVRVGVVQGVKVLEPMLFSPTAAFSSATQLLDWIGRSINQLCNDTRIRSRMMAVGVGVPGVLNETGDSLLRSINVSYLEGAALRQELSEKIRLPVTLVTDAQAATWGTYCRLSIKPNRFVHLRLGTGVACCFVSNTEIIPLVRMGGEHSRLLVVDHSSSARPCICGLRGCLETIASGKAILRMAQEHFPFLHPEPQASARADDLDENGIRESDDRNTKSYLTAVRKNTFFTALQDGILRGNDWCLVMADEVSSAVVEALCSINREFQPDVITIGGGVVTHWPGLIDMVLQHMGKCCSDKNLAQPHIEKSIGDEENGVIGAALLASQ